MASAFLPTTYGCLTSSIARSSGAVFASALQGILLASKNQQRRLGKTHNYSLQRRIYHQHVRYTHRVLSPRASAVSLNSAAASAGAVSGSPVTPLGDHYLNGLSTWIWRKICNVFYHGRSDWLSWLPLAIHDYFHHGQIMAVLVVREVLVATIALAALQYIDVVCCKLNWLWGTFVMRDNNVTDEEYSVSGFSALVGPIQFLVAMCAFMRWSELTLSYFKHAMDQTFVDRTQVVILVSALTCFFLGWKDRALSNSHLGSKLDKTQLTAVDRLGTMALVSIGVFMAAETIGIPLKSISAFGGITGLAVGLASKEVVTNFFGGLVLWLSRPFSIGDSIKAKDFRGTVQDIGFFQTKLLGFDKKEITVPNHVFTNMVITNSSRAKQRNMTAIFELRIEDMFLVDTITEKITKLLTDHEAVEGRPVCYLKSIGNSSLFIRLSATAKATTPHKFYTAQQELLVRAAKIIVDEGACFGSNEVFPPVEVPKLVTKDDRGNRMTVSPVAN